MYVLRNGGKAPSTASKAKPTPSTAGDGDGGAGGAAGAAAADAGDADGYTNGDVPAPYEMFHPDNPHLHDVLFGSGGDGVGAHPRVTPLAAKQSTVPSNAGAAGGASQRSRSGASLGQAATLPHPEHRWLASVSASPWPVVNRVGNADLVVKRVVTSDAARGRGGGDDGAGTAGGGDDATGDGTCRSGWRIVGKAMVGGEGAHEADALLLFL